ncbi:MAG: NAD(P)-dependent alcohol dehydrogenase [Acidimicrobiia bacterium]|nr:NAD(P)-dependent alcohol dehydrogenase [Acidimicrobiia bacterium]
MRAVVQHRYGSDVDAVLRVDTVRVPSIGPREVLVAVQAAAVDRGTWHLLSGTPYATRLAFGVRRPRNQVPGRDLAGMVVAVGPDVRRFSPGDEVYGTGEGSLAAFARAAERRLAPRPAGLNHFEAAAVPVSGLTALQACDAGRLTAGQHVAVVGASGGVGTFAVQIAAARGAEVTGVCSGTKADLVRSLGAGHIIDYTTDTLDPSRARYDVIIDIGGSTPLAALRRSLSPRGMLVLVGGHVGRWLGIGRQLRAVALSPFVGQRLTMLVSRERASDLERLTALVDDGRLRPAVETVFPLVDAPAALEHLVAGDARGKLVVDVRAGA